MASGKAVTKGTFEAEVMKPTVPVIVDFWAEWCPSCKVLTPVLDEIARGMSGRVKLVTVDGDAEPDLAQRFNVMSMPTILIVDKGAVVRQQVGALPRHMMEKIIREVVPA
jgi:thioredoxin